uniref:Undecaprenyl-phosphate galactose phosphotransferase, WbaP n=1 Tax=Cyanothece sp. (strain PCC 7425 / ATCC 29141) TaxID=395961 RepID=B8HXI2_CYAP4
MQLKQKRSLALHDVLTLPRPWRNTALFVLADLLGLTLVAGLTVLGRWLLGGEFHLSLYWQWSPILGLFIFAYAIVGLYPAIGLSPVDELRWGSLTTTLVYLILGSAIFLSRSDETYSRLIFIIAWALSLLTFPILRGAVRYLFARKPWWGCPVMVLGAGKTGDLVVRTLQHHPGLGLKPVVVLDDDPDKQGYLHGIPVLGKVQLAPQLTQQLRISYAILAMPGVAPGRLLEVQEAYGQMFDHLLVIPDLFGFASLWVAPLDLGGLLALDVRQQLLLPLPRLLKTCIDLLLTLLVGLLSLPLLLFIALAIRLDSPGPIFYGHTRLGRRGRFFKAWKFRTMAPNADEQLEQYFNLHPDLKDQWLRDHKLKHDPRLTRVGQFLRRTSLDELPQLWNVLQGEMSLVGPRPIVAAEIDRYEEKFSLYKKVKPGITGLWQVSGRNNISYEERVNLDAYYVRNWSVWLDLYILLRTVWVVITAEGAY